MLYKALVRPQVEYANSIWSPYKQEALLSQRGRACRKEAVRRFVSV